MEDSSQIKSEAASVSSRIGLTLFNIFSAGSLGLRGRKQGDSFAPLSEASERMGITPRDTLDLSSKGILHIYLMSRDFAIKLPNRIARIAVREGMEAVPRAGLRLIHIGSAWLTAWILFLLVPSWPHPPPMAVLAIAILVPGIGPYLYTFFLFEMLQRPLYVDMNSIKSIDCNETTFISIQRPAQEIGVIDAENDASFPEQVSGHPNVSKSLQLVNAASQKWWANADRDDKGTHPINADVSKWLVERGMSPTLAAKAASIIRPDWANAGRPPDE